MKCRILLSVNTNQEYYIEAVEKSGGEAVACYCPEPNTDYDGLILCGGNDMDPEFYGEAIDGSVNIDRPRDDAEWALLKEFIKTGKPVLGICRGFQFLNVFFGGSLYQHIDDVQTHRGSLEHYPVHGVKAEGESMLTRMYAEEFFVNSCHHQGVKKLGAGLRVIAKSGTLVEAFVHEHLPIFGVQWHPEKMCYSSKRDDAVDGAPIFRHFLELCKKTRVEK